MTSSMPLVTALSTHLSTGWSITSWVGLMLTFVGLVMTIGGVAYEIHARHVAVFEPVLAAAGRALRRLDPRHRPVHHHVTVSDYAGGADVAAIVTIAAAGEVNITLERRVELLDQKVDRLREEMQVNLRSHEQTMTRDREKQTSDHDWVSERVDVLEQAGEQAEQVDANALRWEIWGLIVAGIGSFMQALVQVLG